LGNQDVSKRREMLLLRLPRGIGWKENRVRDPIATR
jgi:hypothetical protein